MIYYHEGEGHAPGCRNIMKISRVCACDIWQMFRGGLPAIGVNCLWYINAGMAWNIWGYSTANLWSHLCCHTLTKYIGLYLTICSPSCSGNTNVHLYFISVFNTEILLVVGILFKSEDLSILYTSYLNVWLLMTWWCKGTGHLQPWCWSKLPRILQSLHGKV